MATFTADEIEFLKNHGNDECAKTWLGLWDPKRSSRPKQDHREFMVDKYERKRFVLFLFYQYLLADYSVDSVDYSRGKKRNLLLFLGIFWRKLVR